MNSQSQNLQPKNERGRYRMPAEWNPHAAIWLSWPHNKDTWPIRIAEAQREFVALAETIAKVTPVKVLGGSRDATKNAESAFCDRENIQVVDIPTNDAWIRDYGPTFVHDQQTDSFVAVDWDYNAWGGKYPPFEDDADVTSKIADRLSIRSVSPELCFEGGAIEINDEGVLLCTKSCALDENRNAGASLASFETAFKALLGATNIVWLNGDGIEGDDTDGHIDQLARFVDNHTVVYAWTDDQSDPQFASLQQNLVDLKNGLEQIGVEHRLVPLTLPSQPLVIDDARLPASYCNFLITNDLAVVPQFGDPNDEQAIATLKQLLRGKQVIGLESRYLVAGLGSFHCLSQQQPSLLS